MGNISPKINDSYILNESSVTSAGVFTENGSLLRTLWSNKTQNTNTYSSPPWDGLSDSGEYVKDKASYIKVVANNIEVEWEGVIGNTSDSYSGDHIHRNYDKYHDGVYAEGNLYFSSDWTEAWGSIVEVDTSNLSYKTELMPNKTAQPYPNRMAIDGDIIYFAGRSGLTDASRSYVQACKISELGNFNKQFAFQGVTEEIFGKKFNIADLVIDAATPRVTGLAVQTKGDWLIVARELINSVHVLNKITGVLVQSLTYTEPKHCKIDGNGDLWMVHDEVLEKFRINSNSGALISTGLTIKGFTNVAALAISPDGTTIAIADAAINQQVKGYSTTTGDLLWTLGRSESYLTDAKVFDDKFLFISPEPSLSDGNRGYSGDDKYTFLIYYPDGSLLIGDRDNNRYIKFDSNRDYEEKFMFLRSNYTCNVDPNNAKRLFGGFQEFEIDYSKELIPKNSNNAWKLVANWGGGATVAKHANPFQRLHDVTTLSNGKTYFIALYPNSLEFMELVDGGTIRETGVTMSTVGYTFFNLHADGKVTCVSGIEEGQITRFYEKNITGFDTSDNPILTPLKEIVNFDPSATMRHASVFGASGQTLSNGNHVVFNGHGGGKYHLGVINPNTLDFVFKTAQNVIFADDDPYPANGEFDDRGPESFVYKGSKALTIDNLIIWGYFGEFWRNSQVNKWNIVSEDGLFLKQFGATGRDDFGEYGQIPPEMAGNAFSPSIVKVGDTIYLYHNDEGYHAGLHRWKISNLNSVKSFSLDIE
ncbi:MAG: hypothetical protein ACSHXG_13130 [Maribacter stanieri]